MYSKKITSELTVKFLVEQGFEPYEAPKEVHSDEDVRIQSDIGWYKRVLDALNVQGTTCGPYTHNSNPLCERQNGVVEQNLTVLMNQECTKGLVCLLPVSVRKSHCHVFLGVLDQGQALPKPKEVMKTNT